MLNVVHPAQVAGLFYPAEPDALRTLIAGMRKGARSDGGVTPKAVVAPHAGIVYSGSVAATSFGAWARRAEPPTRIVIVGPAHRVAFRGLAIHPAAAWSTPLGEAKVARDLHIRLAEAEAATVDAKPFAGEHSLEMHLVMLQAMLPKPFEVLPILVGDATPAQVAAALRLVWGGPETGIAISSDLSHFLEQANARAVDADTARFIERLDVDSLEGRRACGYLPIGGALTIAAERDLRVSGLHLATSADVGADASRVVGYGAFAMEYAASARLEEADRALLISTAMASLAAAARSGGRMPSLAVDGRLSPTLTSMRATFVTLTHEGRLRGCIGSPAPRTTLIEDVVTNAVNAGCGDPRFDPLSEAELENSRTRRLDPLASAADPGSLRGGAGRGAGAEPGRAHSRQRAPAGAVPAERVAAGRGRTGVRAPSPAQGRARSDDFPDGPRGPALPGRGVRRAVPARERRRDRAGQDRRGRLSSAAQQKGAAPRRPR